MRTAVTRERPRSGYSDVPVDPHLFDIAALTALPPERIDWLRGAIDDLPDEERDVVNALYFERLTKGQICRRFELKRHDLERVLRRAYRTLREDANGSS